MSTRFNSSGHAREILRLGGPLIVNNVANAGMTFVDTVMAGQLGARELAGLGVGVAYYSLSYIVGMGVMMAIAPIVAQAYGACNKERIRAYAHQTLWLALTLSLVLMSVLLQSRWVMNLIGTHPDVVPIAVAYCKVVSAGLPALFAFFALRFISEGIGCTQPIMYTAVSGLVLKVLGNWLLVYGHFGFPRLGAVGCAVATAISAWCMLITLWLHMRRNPVYRPYRILEGIEPPHAGVLLELLRIGVPIAGLMLLEGGLFIATTLLMGTMSPTIVAAHQIALNYATFTFMLPLALSSATVIHVGHRLGVGDAPGARRAGFTGIALCASAMALSAIILLATNESVAGVYTNDKAVRQLAAALLLMAGAFQLSDGLQVGAAGALRGYKDTLTPLVGCLIAYWCIGFPLAYFLGITRGLGPIYVWIGLIIGLTVAAVVLNWRFWRVSAWSSTSNRQPGAEVSAAP